VRDSTAICEPAAMPIVDSKKGYRVQEDLIMAAPRGAGRNRPRSCWRSAGSPQAVAFFHGDDLELRRDKFTDVTTSLQADAVPSIRPLPPNKDPWSLDRWVLQTRWLAPSLGQLPCGDGGGRDAGEADGGAATIEFQQAQTRDNCSSV
jgi:hypothetical protein